MDTAKIIKALNHALVQEHACAVRYMTHAELVTGLSAESVSARLKEIGGDEWDHAQKLRSRITALGGTPAVEMSKVEIATETNKILDINIREEKDAIVMYQALLRLIPKLKLLRLYETIEDIIQDEEEHLEELTRLRG